MNGIAQQIIMTLLMLSTSAGLVTAGTLLSPAGPDAMTEQHHRQTIVLGLGGYSPVSYIEDNKAIPGSPAFAAEHDGVTYFLASARQRRLFLASPDRFMPAYGGYCAFGCSVEALFVPDPTSFEIIDGRTHLFLKNKDIDAKMLWNESPSAAVKAKASTYWSAQTMSRAYVNGHNVPASGIGLQGFSPVSYFTVGHAEPGDARHAVTHNGVTYHLTSAEQVQAFNQSPDAFVPQYGGWCALGMAVQDKFPIDPTLFKIVDGKLYLFLKNASVDALELWDDGNESELLAKADAHWKTVSGK